ncbi:MAG TPA: immunoglobulin-like domain-containing protein [Solirubrobacterales bacterium]|nr:immunoglobulin-like domain-containing protein [Solirubrobacterales bacterium]
MIALNWSGVADAECGPVVKDYLAPLSGLPKISPPAAKLSFAPNAFAVRAFDPGSLVSGSSVEVGLRLEARRSKAVRWTVQTRLVRVGRRHLERQIEEVSSRVGRMTASESRRVALTSPVDAGLYRWETRFVTPSGRLLGRYGRNFRVLAPQFEAQISFDKPSYAPGETLLPCLENLGSETISYGAPYRIEREVNGSWEKVLPQGEGIWTLIGYSNTPGTAATHWSVTLPSDLAVGNYRFVVDAEVTGSASAQPAPGHRRPVTIFGMFSVAT